MLLTNRWANLALGVLAALACAAGPLRAAVTPPPLQYDISTLSNGLSVILSEDHSTPIVHVAVYYHVGSKNERKGRTGFAHLFEHMMFKGSKNVRPEEHMSLIASVGGQANAYTTEDETVFWQTLPAQHLPLAAWLEADRMATLRVDKDTFVNEREVVKEERRMRFDNQPYGNLQEILLDQTFTTHPYKHPTIGSMDDLQAASIDDVRDFFQTYYVPENATLVVVGDFETAQAKAIVEQYFGRVPKAAKPVPRDIPAEPAQREEKRVTVQAPWPLPAVIVAYHITFDGHPDSYPLHIAGKVMTDGDSSRMYQSLVYDTRLAVTAFGGANLIEDPNLFYTAAIVQPGRTAEETAAAIIEQVDRLKTGGITDRELQRAKNQFARDYIVDRQTVRQKALQLAHAVVIHKDITTADGEFQIFQRMSASDVQRVAQTYFTDANRTVITIVPSTPAGGSR